MSDREPRTVVYLPLEPHRAESLDGLVVASAGPGFEQVVVTLTPVAARQLATVLFNSPLLVETAGDSGKVARDTWYGFAVDLTSSAGMCEPDLFQPPVHVPLYRGSTP